MATALAMLGALLIGPSASAAGGPVVQGVQFSRCIAALGCDFRIVGTGLLTVTSVTTSPSRPTSIQSQTDTLIVVQIPSGQPIGTVDVVVNDPAGNVTLPDALLITANEGEFVSTDPFRALDTRSPAFGGNGPLAPGESKVLDFSSSALPGISSAASLVLNLTVTEPTAPGYLTAYPGDAARPLASNLNFVAGQTVPNLVSVTLAPDRTIRIFNGSQGTSHIIVDVVGYHTTSGGGSGSRLLPIEPYRAYDSRDDSPFSSDDGYVDLDLGTLPAGTTAVALNVTAVNGTSAGYVTVFPSSAPNAPIASNLNVAGSAPVPNMVVVGATPSAVISVATNLRQVDLIFDVVGVYMTLDAFVPPLPEFGPVTPSRVLDTRTGTGAPAAPLVGGYEIVLNTAAAGIPADADAVLLNVTVTQPTTPGYLSVWPGGVARPLVSSLNFVAGQTVANLVLVPVGSDGTVRFLAPTGTVHVVADVTGYYHLR